METFDKFIKDLPKDLDVLDIGCFGHEGENTSVFLGNHFDKILGFNINTKVFKSSNKYPNYEVIIDNFYDYKFRDRQFDLVVSDMTIELNLLNDWCDEGIERIKKLVRPGGYWINFVMMTDQYGDPAVTPDLIRWHSQRFWGSETPNSESVGQKLTKLKGWELVVAEPEQRRDYILWVMLKRTDGLSSETEESSSQSETPMKPTPSSSKESSSSNSTTTKKVSSLSKTKKVKTK